MRPPALIVFALAVLLAPGKALAIDTRRPVVERIGILRTAPPRSLGIDPVVKEVLPRYLKSTLRDLGFDVRMIDSTIDDLTTGTDDDILIDVGYATERGEPLGAVGAGGSIEGVGVGGEVAVVQAAAVAEIRVYHGKTLEPLLSVDLDAETASPALTGIELGDPGGWFRFRIPLSPKGPLKQVAKEIARDAASMIQEEFGR